MTCVQDKSREINFFNSHARLFDEYNAFTDESNMTLIQNCIELSQLSSNALVVDIGCGSGIFTRLMQRCGYRCFGIDISQSLLAAAASVHPGQRFLAADAELLPLRDESVDGVLLSGLLHHFPDPRGCAREVFRVLRRNGVFVAFDPNRMNPFMYLYRDKSSPFYSNVGVTVNERPVLARHLLRDLTKTGFDVTVTYLSGLHYRYVASPLIRKALPIYNLVDELLFRWKPLRKHSAFVLTKGIKR